MKKMVCEICESQNIKKENGIFVCQECGTQYSLEEAKKLLTDIGDSNTLSSSDKHDVKITNSKENKYELIKKLSMWIDALISINGTKYWFDIDYIPNDVDFWNKMRNIDSFEPIVPDYSDFLEAILRKYNFDRLYIGELANKDPCSLFYSSPLYNLVDSLNKFRDHYWQHANGKTGYRFFVRTEDGHYNKLIHDLANDDAGYLKVIIDLSKTGKTYYLYERTWNNSIWWNKLEDYRRTTINGANFTNIIKNAGDYVDSLYHYNEKVVERYKETFPEAKEKYIKMMHMIETLENDFLVPIKYRTPQILYYIMDIIASGRADDWKEAVNHYETDVYRNSTLFALSTISANLQRLDITLQEGFSTISNQLMTMNQELCSVSNSLNSINQSVGKISSGVDYIAFDTFWRD